MDLMYKTPGYCQIFRKRGHKADAASPVHPYLDLPSSTFNTQEHTVFTSNIFKDSTVVYTYLLSSLCYQDQPFISGHPHSLTVCISKEQTFCNVHNIYSSCHMHFSYHFLLKDFPNVTF